MPPSRLQPRGLTMHDPLGPDAPRGSGRWTWLFDALRLRPVGRRSLSAVSLVAFLAGAGLFVYPFTTDVYATQTLQPRLEAEFESVEFRQQFLTQQVAAGDPLTKIVIAQIGLESLVVEGTSPAALRAGAGHYPTTPMPGAAGNVAIAGHRTTFGKPFNRIDELAPGAQIILETPLTTYTYTVVPAPSDVRSRCPSGACWVTSPTDWAVVGPTDGAMLTLTTCHPKGSARQRLILRAELTSSVDKPL